MENKKKVKLKDIADKMGISIVSVSNALNGREGVSPELRKQIIKTAVDMNYQFKKIKEKQKVKKKTVGIIYTEEEQIQALYGKTDLKLLEKGVAQIGYRLNIFSQTDKKQNIKEGFLKKNKLHGVLIVGNIYNKTLQKKLRESEIPLLYLYVGNYMKENNYIAPDYFRGAQICVQKMISRGHHKIWVLKNSHTYGGITTDICLGYEKTMDLNDIDEKKEIELSEAKKIMEEKRELPTAFLCEDIDLARKLQMMMKKNDIHDKDISIVTMGIIQDDADIKFSGIYYLQKDILALCKNALEKKYYNRENGGRVLVVQGKFNAGSTLYKTK